MYDPMPLLIKKNYSIFGKIPGSSGGGGSNQGPLGPTNLEASVLLNELSSLLKNEGSEFDIYR